MEGDLPAPAMFNLDVAEIAALRYDYFAASGGPLMLRVMTFSAGVQLLAPALRIYRYRGHDPYDWVLVALTLTVLAAIVWVGAFRSSFLAMFLRPQLGITVRFDATGIDVSRAYAGSLIRKHVDFSSIRSVRSTPNALLIFGRWKAIVIIPKRVLDDNGAHVMSFFERHLVAGRMLRRSSAMSTTIVNTSFP